METFRASEQYEFEKREIRDGNWSFRMFSLSTYPFEGTQSDFFESRRHSKMNRHKFDARMIKICSFRGGLV